MTKSPKIEVAYQGVRGAFSELASRAVEPDARYRSCKTLEEVFDRIEARKSDCGVIPIENSLGGIISQTYDLLLERKLKITAEHQQPIEQCLLVSPGTKIGQIKRVYSHPQALAQCFLFLKKHPSWEAHAVYDTAGAAEIVAEGALIDTAAIASARAGEIYGLDILARGIQDTTDNVTRFVRIGRETPMATGKDRTSLVFSAGDRPGALYKSLSIFAIRDVNLKKLESRPSKKKPWDYIFYLDLEGHIDEDRIQRCIAHLEEISQYVKLLGSYPMT